jgi:hypothetical protein
MSKLGGIYKALRSTAVQQGADQRHDLPQVARLTVRVRDGIETVTFARRAAPVGSTEERTFHRHCAVPPGAERIPPEGQQTRQDERGWEWHLVTYRWQVEGEQQPLLTVEQTEA